MLSNVDAGQSRKTKRCYTPAEYCFNSPIRPADGGNNFVLLTRQLLKEEVKRIPRVRTNSPFDLP